jgi:radical SAM superfamily enzyme YgiQ (UPF0313 family)
MVKENIPNLLLINPWIHDFAAYDLWIKPLGLLSLAAFLRRNGFAVHFIDCLDAPQPKKRKLQGQGKFHKEEIEKPSPLKCIPRKYSRYGMNPIEFEQKLLSFPEPEVILVTSSMTYWYPGVFEAISRTKKLLPGVPVVLGGIYASLCTDHARAHAGSDFVFSGYDVQALLGILDMLTCKGNMPQRSGGKTNTFHPYPAFDLYTNLRYVAILSSRGCPYRCPYCASHLMHAQHSVRRPSDVVDELAFWLEVKEITDVVFYDDALLLNPENHFVPIIEEIIRRDLKLFFHVPNGLHLRGITQEVAELLYRAPFGTIRFGLETADELRLANTGNKTTRQEYLRAMKLLHRAGYSSNEIGVYLLAGLPGQEAKEVETSIMFVHDSGARPYLAEYSPVPGTAFWADALSVSAYNLQDEPLFHNNSIFPCESRSFSRGDLNRLKQLLPAPS